MKVITINFSLTNEAVLRASVVALIVFAPLLIYGVDIYGINMRISRLIFLIFAPVLAIAICRAPEKIAVDKLFMLVLLPFYTYSLMSVLWSNDFNGYLNRMAMLTEVNLIYIYVRYAGSSEVNSQHILNAYIYSAILPILIAYWQLSNVIFRFDISEVPFISLLIPEKYNNLESYGAFGSLDGFSRLSSSFGEPNMFAGYLSTIILLSFLFSARNRTQKNVLLFIQISAIMMLILTVSKSGILSFAIGYTIIALKIKKFRHWFKYIVIVLSAILIGLAMQGFDDALNRFTDDTGHVDFMMEVLDSMSNINLFIGEGFGSYEFGSSHRFILTRIYEGGFFGLLFSIVLSLFPIAILCKIRNTKKTNEEKIIVLAASVSIILGLNLYDYFIHLFPWTVAAITANVFLKKGLNKNHGISK